MNHNRVTLLAAVIAAVTYSHKYQPGKKERTCQAAGQTTAGAGAAQIKFFGSNAQAPGLADDTDWVELGTIDLVLGVARVSGGFVTDAPWTHIRAKLVSISGTNAAIDAYMGA